MRIFDRKGMLIIPEPPPKKEEKQEEDILLVNKCFCPKGHNLISPRVKFNKFPGIFLKVHRDKQEGLVGLSPVYGEKCRISMDIELQSDELIDLFCPQCNTQLPAFSSCSCGGNILALFLNDKGDFADCIGICNRVDCHNAVVKHEGELLTQTMLNSSKKKSGLRTSFSQ